MPAEFNFAGAGVRGETIMALRRQFSLSRRRLAAASKIEAWRLRDIENGETDPTPDEWWAIGESLKLRPGLLDAMVEGVRARTCQVAQRLLGQTTGAPWKELLGRVGLRGLRQLAALAALVQCQLDDITVAAKLSEPHIPRRRDRNVE